MLYLFVSIIAKLLDPLLIIAGAVAAWRRMEIASAFAVIAFAALIGEAILTATQATRTGQHSLESFLIALVAGGIWYLAVGYIRRLWTRRSKAPMNDEKGT